jgi:hypothetical protein
MGRTAAIPSSLPAGSGAESELWRALGYHLGSRLSLEMESGWAVRVRNCWLELDQSNFSAAERVESLILFAVEQGASERETRAIVTARRAQVSEGDFAKRRRRRDEMRVALTEGA